MFRDQDEHLPAGACVYFTLTIAVRPGETADSMGNLVRREFERGWDAAARDLLK